MEARQGGPVRAVSAREPGASGREGARTRVKRAGVERAGNAATLSSDAVDDVARAAVFIRAIPIARPLCVPRSEQRVRQSCHSSLLREYETRLERSPSLVSSG